MSQLNWSHDPRSCHAIFLSALRRLLDGAGRGPHSPQKEGWINVRGNPALTEALAALAVHGGVTVGQSVETCLAGEPVVGGVGAVGGPAALAAAGSAGVVAWPRRASGGQDGRARLGGRKL